MLARFSYLWFILFAVLVAGCRATDPHFNIVAAYGEVETEQQGLIAPVFNDKGGGVFSMGADSAVGKVAENGSGLMLGGRIGLSAYREDISERIVAGEPQLTIEEFADLLLITPQATASYRQVFGDRRRGVFIEPGVGVGVTVAEMLFGSEFQFGDDPVGVDYGEDEWEFGFSVSPFLRGGLVLDRLLIGVEGGYQWSFLEFDAPLGADPSEWYAGAFIAIKLGPS